MWLVEESLQIRWRFRAIGGRNIKSITLPKQLQNVQASLRYFLETTKIFELKNSKILLKNPQNFEMNLRNFQKKKTRKLLSFKSQTFPQKK